MAATKNPNHFKSTCMSAGANINQFSNMQSPATVFAQNPNISLSEFQQMFGLSERTYFNYKKRYGGGAPIPVPVRTAKTKRSPKSSANTVPSHTAPSDTAPSGTASLAVVADMLEDAAAVISIAADAAANTNKTAPAAPRGLSATAMRIVRAALVAVGVIEMAMIGIGLFLLFNIVGLVVASMVILIMIVCQVLVMDADTDGSASTLMAVIFFINCAAVWLHYTTLQNWLHEGLKMFGSANIICLSLAVFISAISYTALIASQRLTWDKL